MKNKKKIFFAIITKLISQENIKKAQIQKEEFLRKDDGISGPIKLENSLLFFSRSILVALLINGEKL